MGASLLALAKSIYCTLILSFAGQPEEFPWSGLQLVTKGRNSLAIFHISRTLRSILAVPTNAAFCTCPGLTLIPIF